MSWDEILKKARTLAENNQRVELSRKERTERIKKIMEDKKKRLNSGRMANLSAEGKAKVNAEVFTLPLEAFDDRLRK